MKDDVNYDYEVFNIYYSNAQKAMARGDKARAKLEYLNAAKSLLELAKKTDGELQKVRMERADRIIALANSISVEPSASEAKSDPLSFGEKKSSKPSEKQNSGDDTETIWEAANIPSISFADVAGLDEVKNSVNMRVLLPMQHPDIYKKFQKKTGGGILLYGLPGTGKTMIAKAIAHEANAVFFSVKCSDIVSKWFGEAEKNIKNLFAEARKNQRAIIFFDEFEALAPKRGGNSTVMNRVVPELLAEIQGFSDGEDDKMLLLLAATNRPWDIDSAMLRPGRFNEMIYVPLPDYDARLYMLSHKLEKVPKNPDVSFEQIAKLTEGYNGSDIDELCERLKNGPILRAIKSGNPDEAISLDDVASTLAKMITSVQKEDIEKLKSFEQERKSL
jgi:SpoVK/Ycf46/Vps4 family AAA+-type ATPase